MIIDIFLYSIVPLLIVFEKLFKKTGLALLVYYSVVTVFILIFFQDFKEIFSGDDAGQFFSLFKAAGIVIYPLAFFLSIKNVNSGVVKITYGFVNYVVYPLAIAYRVYITIKFGWGSQMEASESLASDLVLTIFIFMSALILLGLVIKDQLETKRVAIHNGKEIWW
jgi:hypothetical protein